MVFSFINVLLAAFGLGVLIFIHELGHYWMARRVGMTVEAFSIGFGKPIRVWERKGVKWQLCWLPFGGYVRIAGMEKKGNLEPYQIPDGFYGKKPWARIKVAAMGPIVNLCFAFILFCVLWISGGRPKPFSEYTHHIGWVDPCSGLQSAGVRAGDEITQLNDKPFHSFHDLLYASMLDDRAPTIAGWKIDYFFRDKSPFSYTFPIEPNIKGMDRANVVNGAFSPAEYLLYAPYPGNKQNPLPPGSPMIDSGIEYGDRIIWVDGNIVFSRKELIRTINESKALITVQRGSKTLMVRVPRMKVSDLRLSAPQRLEIEDWQHAGQIQGKVQDLFFIPYTVTSRAVIEGPVSFFNADARETLPCSEVRSPIETPLQPQDQIIAVDGIKVLSSIELFKLLQTRHIQIIVNRETNTAPISWKAADSQFTQSVEWKTLYQMIGSIGAADQKMQVGSLRFLKSVEPKQISDLPLSQEAQMQRASELSAQKKAIEEIEDPQVKRAALRQWEEGQRRVVLGLTLQDRSVHFNPSPFVLFGTALQETWRTLVALITGYLSPKWLAGPVGMVQVMHYSWSVGVKEAIFWLAMISLNLGVLNFLPVPVLDGGHICFSLWEAVTKKPIPSKTMERLIIPFILLLIALFVYLTYNDIVRLFSRFF